jgi:hypothetical protein
MMMVLGWVCRHVYLRESRIIPKEGETQVTVYNLIRNKTLVTYNWKLVQKKSAKILVFSKLKGVLGLLKT